MRREKRIIILGLAMVVSTVAASVAANGWWRARMARAAETVLTSRADFESGYFSNIDSKGKEGDLTISASGTWGARVWKTPKVGGNNQSAIVSDGSYLYMLPNGDSHFSRYIPNEDRWETLARAPHVPMAGTDMVVLGDYIYTIFGSWTKEFSRYSISRNTWENLVDTYDLVESGASLGTDGTSIYLLRGSGSTDFWRFNVASQTWSTLTGPPATIGAGANLVYYNGYFFTPRGSGTNTFTVMG